MQHYDLANNKTIIIPPQASSFLSKVQSKTRDRVRYRSIEAEVNSIQHKLNVIRYHAGLIQTLSEKDYGDFHAGYHDPNKFSYAYYQDRCVFTMSNTQEYALFLTLFLETLAAGSFSLFDITAHLLTDLFDLPLPKYRDERITKNISYKNVLQEDKLSRDFPDLYNFLYRYRATSQNRNASTDQVSWIDPLEAIRHQITHKPITDIVDWQRKIGVYNTEETIEFLIREVFFQNQTHGDELKSFAEKCFDGIADFVDELFQKLIIEVDNSGFVPI